MNTAALSPRRIHAMYSICAWAIGVLSGVLAMGMLRPAWWPHSWGWFAAGCIVSAMLVYIGRIWSLVVIALLGGAVGMVRGAIDISSIVQLVPHYDMVVTVRGVVAEDVDQAKNGTSILRIKDVDIYGKRISGVLWVGLAGQAVDVRRSDTVTVRGVLKPGFGAFSGAMRRASIERVVREVGRDPFVVFRDWLSSGIHQMLGEREAALGAGYVLGQKRAIAPDFEEALRIVGLTHVVVASGYNLTILVRLARRLFGRISRYMAAFAGSSMVLVFVSVTGMNPSMMRAGMVAGISLAAWYYGRQLHPGVLLIITAAASVLVQPSFAWGDVGWLLSFAAFAGVMLFAPVLQSYLYGDKKSGTIQQIIGETFSAQLYTMPIVMMSFGTVSVVALVVNMLILPLIPLAMIAVFATGLLAHWLPWLAAVVAQPTQLLLSYMTGVIDIFAELSWAAYDIKIDWPLMAAMYIVIIGATVWLYRRSTVSYRQVNLVE